MAPEDVQSATVEVNTCALCRTRLQRFSPGVAKLCNITNNNEICNDLKILRHCWTDNGGGRRMAGLSVVPLHDFAPRDWKGLGFVLFRARDGVGEGGFRLCQKCAPFPSQQEPEKLSY